VAKARVCKTLIMGSNPIDASMIGKEPNGSFFVSCCAGQANPIDATTERLPKGRGVI
jgi:hypothetical protein